MSTRLVRTGTSYRFPLTGQLFPIINLLYQLLSLSIKRWWLCEAPELARAHNTHRHTDARTLGELLRTARDFRSTHTNAHSATSELRDAQATQEERERERGRGNAREPAPVIQSASHPPYPPAAVLVAIGAAATAAAVDAAVASQPQRGTINIVIPMAFLQFTPIQCEYEF